MMLHLCPSRTAPVLALLLMLGAATAACAQQPDRPSVPPRPDDEGAVSRTFAPDSFYAEPMYTLMPAPQALMRLAEYRDGQRDPGLDRQNPFASIAVTRDSAAYFAAVERLAREYAAQEERGEYLAYEALETLRALGATRPYFRTLAFDAVRNEWLAGAAILVLAQDPRETEDEELTAYLDWLADRDRGYEVDEPISEYGGFVFAERRYRALPNDTATRTRFLVGDPFSPTWARSRLHALYAQDPVGVEAAIRGFRFPPSDLPSWGTPRPIRFYQDEMLEIARAPTGAVPPPTIPGPFLPASPLAITCNGRPATVYVAAGRVVGGPLAGTPFAGRLVGTPAADVIVGTDAADAVLGLAGDDTLCGGTGDDALDSGPGTDTADGGPGADGCDASETATACEGAVPALTDVRPVLECVTQATPGGPLTAYFGYENRGTRAGRVAYSANNRITPAAFDRSQPDLFGLPSVVAGRPGRSPFYPGHAFTVTFQPGQNVVWKLFTRTSTASSGSARCPAP